MASQAFMPASLAACGVHGGLLFAAAQSASSRNATALDTRERRFAPAGSECEMRELRVGRGDPHLRSALGAATTLACVGLSAAASPRRELGGEVLDARDAAAGASSGGTSDLPLVTLAAEERPDAGWPKEERPDAGCAAHAVGCRWAEGPRDRLPGSAPSSCCFRASPVSRRAVSN